MKKIARRLLAGVALSTVASTVFAAASGRQDDSMTLVYLFLGVCGLIIFLQLIPVFALAFGMVKGFFGHGEEDAKPAAVRHR